MKISKTLDEARAQPEVRNDANQLKKKKLLSFSEENRTGHSPPTHSEDQTRERRSNKQPQTLHKEIQSNR
jgi:hypothetical protein